MIHCTLVFVDLRNIIKEIGGMPNMQNFYLKHPPRTIVERMLDGGGFDIDRMLKSRYFPTNLDKSNEVEMLLNYLADRLREHLYYELSPGLADDLAFDRWLNHTTAALYSYADTSRPAKADSDYYRSVSDRFTRIRGTAITTPTECISRARTRTIP